MTAKFRSFTNHMIDKHVGHGEHPDFDRCQHADNIEPSHWLEEGNFIYNDSLPGWICRNLPKVISVLASLIPIDCDEATSKVLLDILQKAEAAFPQMSTLNSYPLPEPEQLFKSLRFFASMKQLHR